MATDRTGPDWAKDGTESPDDLPRLGFSAPVERVRRRGRYTSLITIVLSGIAGAVVAWLLTNEPPTPPPLGQSLAAGPSTSASPTPEPEPETQVLGPRHHNKPNKNDKNRTTKRRHDKIVIAGKKNSGGGSSYQAPTYSAPASSSNSQQQNQPKEKPKKAQQEPAMRWPSATLYHLYRKRDKQHYYTVSAAMVEARRTSDGYKDRLSPGLVYTENLYPKKLMQIWPYGVNQNVFIFRQDQGNETVPLYRLSSSGGRELYTSWPDIRNAWLERGWADRGVIGFIYRP